jgi:crossover junction endodeoxyribonuclease RuvC
MTTTHIIGIDPGLSGAIALLEVASGELFDVTDMPTASKIKANGDEETIIDIAGLAEIIGDYADHAEYRSHVHVVIEKQSTRPGQAYAFKTGFGFGLLVMAAQALGCDGSIITPQEWKAAHGLIGAGGDLKGAARTRAIKTASRQTAMKLHPHHRDLFKRAKDDGRAEAVLIASAHLRSLTAHP